jgi:hypothetical protein
MVWHSWAAGLPGNASLGDFYPGDDWVDWIGVSVFQQFYPNNVGGTVGDLEQVLQFASDHYKPTMIAESTPFGGIHNNPHINNSETDIWHAWFRPTLNLIKDHEISMWSYINCNWDVQPLWAKAGFGDTRLSTDSTLMDKWYDFVTGSRRFIRATDYELCSNYISQYTHFDDDKFHYKRYHMKSSHQHDYDDERHRSRERISENSDSTDGRVFWGHERVVGGDGIWEAVLPLVMLASSLAIVFFMFFTSKRRVNRLERTPRRQRVRFAFLDAKEDDDDGSTALYGSIGSTDDSEHSRWRRSVRRVGRQLVLDNTADGTTVVA